MTDKRTLIAAAVTVMVLAVAYGAARRLGQQLEAPGPAASVAARPAGATNEFRVDATRLPAGGPPTFTMQQGESASFTVVAPRSGKLAVHGYTEDMALTENQPLRFTLKTELSGRFPMHIHGADGSHTEVATVEVIPRR